VLFLKKHRFKAPLVFGTFGNGMKGVRRVSAAEACVCMSHYEKPCEVLCYAPQTLRV
jgi:hypothetical protein